ncbi:MAG: SIR2 family protein, partial [Gemmatimonadota bacterium]|nr:SIR2 family protein [Gemmatimonadota bacterium]
MSWRDSSRVERVLRGDELAVIHLHGHWEDPESVILGIRSYEEVLDDAHAGAMLRAVRSLRCIVYVGCAEGLVDPHFSAFSGWARGVFSGSEYRSFLITRENEVAKLQAQH